MTLDTNIAERLTGWLRTQLPDAEDVGIEDLDPGELRAFR